MYIKKNSDRQSNSKMKYKSRIIVNLLYLALFLTLVQCTFSGSLVEPPPAVLQFIEGPAEGDTLGIDRATLSWQGSEQDFQFEYNMIYRNYSEIPVDYIEWSGYTPFTGIVLENLDEGSYEFNLKGLNNGIESGPITLNFYVNAVTGPTLLFFRTKTVTQVDTLDSVSITMEDVDSLSEFKVSLIIDPAYLEIQDISAGELLASTGEFNAPVYSDTTFITRENSTGNIIVSSGIVVSMTSNNGSVSGTGEVLKIAFRPKIKGVTELEFISIDMRNTQGERIRANITKKGIVEIL